MRSARIFVAVLMVFMGSCTQPLDINTPRLRTEPVDVPDSSSLVHGERVSLVLAFDASGSMQGYGIDAARAGGLRILEYFDGRQDEAMVVIFNQGVTIYQQMTTDTTRLRAAVSGLTANGQTALWDAALLSVQMVVNNGVNPRRAVILFSDGDDNASSSGDGLDFISTAASNKVVMSAIAFGAEAPVAKLKRVSDGTGGRFESAATAAEAELAFARILRDLRIAAPGK
ncbi:MAG: VWA domain-containing protein [Ignavibacteria bacterium]|nr:VWA domain-containing protein [Ignavibacteria bacterium]